MAIYGLKYLAWAPIASEGASALPTYTSGAGIVLGKMVSLSTTVNNSEGSLYADDALAEYVAEFTDADVSIAVDNISLANQAKLFGATVDSSTSEFTMASSDTPPYGGLGGIQIVLNSGVKEYRGWFFPKFKAAIPDEESSTKGDSISFGTQPIKGKALACNTNAWQIKKSFTTEADAKAWVNDKLGITG